MYLYQVALKIIKSNYKKNEITNNLLIVLLLAIFCLMVHAMSIQNSSGKLNACKTRKLKFYEFLHIGQPQSILPNCFRLFLNSETHIIDLAELVSEV